MILDIKRYFLQYRQTSLRDLSLHFETDVDAMRGMLQPWINKGKLRKSPVLTNCGGCSEKCLSANEGEMEVYEWIDQTECNFQKSTE